jgi:hypothetical protein
VAALDFQCPKFANSGGFGPDAFGSRSPSSGGEIVVGQFRIDDRVAVVLEIGRLYTACGRIPAVEEEDGHLIVVRFVDVPHLPW